MTQDVDQGRPNRSSVGNRTFWGLADQGVVSAGNFLTNLALLRFLSPSDFGTYALLLSAMIFLNTVQQSLIGYPLCVRGAQATDNRFRWLLCSGLTATAGLFLANLLVLLAVCFWVKNLLLLIPLGAALFFWQLQDTLRGGFLSKLRQREGIAGDAVSYLGQAAVVAMFCHFRYMSVSGAMWVVAGTSLCGFAVQFVQLRPAWQGKDEVQAILQDFWMLGRWNLPARFLGFFTLGAFPWVIALRHGTAQVAIYQALFLLLALSNPILLSMGNLITAAIAQSRRRLARDGSRYILLAFLLPGTYLLILGISAPNVLAALYGSTSSFVAYGSLLRMFAFSWIFEVIAMVSLSILGGMERVTGLFWVQMSGCISAVLIALPLVYENGVAFAGIGLFLVNFIRAACGVSLVGYASGGQRKKRAASLVTFDEGLM